jgi:hypothetical protein
MKVSKSISMEHEFEFDITWEEIAASLHEESDRPGAALRGLNNCASLMRGITPEAIAEMNPTQRQIISNFLAAQSLRYAGKTAYQEVEEERRRQDQQWGGPEHDDQHAAHRWLQFIHRQVVKQRGSPARGFLVKIAALAIAGIESIDRKAAPPTSEAKP